MENLVFNGLKLTMIEPKASCAEDTPVFSFNKAKSITIEAKLDYINKPLLNHLVYTRFHEGLEYPYDLFELARNPSIIDKLSNL